MTKDEAVKAAVILIGEKGADDYILSPANHSKEFEQSAPALAAILQSSAIRSTARDFESKDNEALAAQQNFKTVSSRANWLILFTSVFAALILVAGTMAASIPDNLERGLIITLGLLSVLTGAWASRDLYLIKQGKLLEDWMKKRAIAETYRLDYFSRIVNSVVSDTTAGNPVQLLKLEYFRRFQLDIQLTYYRKRGAKHAAEASGILGWGGLAVIGAAVMAGAAGILAVNDSRFTALASLGAIFAAITSFENAKEAISQNRRNAERYGRTYEVLNEVNKRLDDVRGAVFDEGDKPLVDFMAAVHEQISLEHRQWLDDQSEYQKGIADLDQTLADNKAKNK